MCVCLKKKKLWERLHCKLCNLHETFSFFLFFQRIILHPCGIKLYEKLSLSLSLSHHLVFKRNSKKKIKIFFRYFSSILFFLNKQTLIGQLENQFIRPKTFFFIHFYHHHPLTHSLSLSHSLWRPLSLILLFHFYLFFFLFSFYSFLPIHYMLQ